MNELPKQAGRYQAAKSIMLCVPSLGKPFFEIRVSAMKAGHQQQLTRKLYINVLHPYLKQLDFALDEEYRMRTALQRKVEEYVQQQLNLNVETTSKYYNNEKRERERAERHAARTLAARRDVQAVWAFYGPEIEMRKPFYIFQWI